MTSFTYNNTPFDLLTYEEGYVGTVYLCSTGYPTLGFGRRVIVLDYETGKPVEFPIRREVEAKHLESKADLLHDWLAERFPFYLKLSPQRQAVLVSLAYQTGRDGFCGFTDMIKALTRGDFTSAANEYLDSKAARQAPKRFARGARILMDNLTVDEVISKSGNRP